MAGAGRVTVYDSMPARAKEACQALLGVTGSPTSAGHTKPARIHAPGAPGNRRWGLQLRLLAAVLAQHFHDAHLRSKVSWLQSIAKQETVEQLSMATLKVGGSSERTQGWLCRTPQ